MSSGWSVTCPVCERPRVVVDVAGVLRFSIHHGADGECSNSGLPLNEDLREKELRAPSSAGLEVANGLASAEFFNVPRHIEGMRLAGQGHGYQPEANALPATLPARLCNGGPHGRDWCGKAATVVCTEREENSRLPPSQWFACDDVAHQEGAHTEQIRAWFVRHGLVSQ